MPLTYKHCTDCGGGPWPPQRFYRNGKRKDGSYRYTGRCRDCCIKATRENVEAKADYYKAQKAERAKQPYYVELRRAYRQTERGKQIMKESRKAWRVCHPEQHQAIQRRWNSQRNRSRATRNARDSANLTNTGNTDGYQDSRSPDAGHRRAGDLQDVG